MRVGFKDNLTPVLTNHRQYRPIPSRPPNSLLGVETTPQPLVNPWRQPSFVLASSLILFTVWPVVSESDVSQARLLDGGQIGWESGGRLGKEPVASKSNPTSFLPSCLIYPFSQNSLPGGQSTGQAEQSVYWVNSQFCSYFFCSLRTRLNLNTDNQLDSFLQV